MYCYCTGWGKSSAKRCSLASTPMQGFHCLAPLDLSVFGGAFDGDGQSMGASTSVFSTAARGSVRAPPFGCGRGIRPLPSHQLRCVRRAADAGVATALNLASADGFSPWVGCAPFCPNLRRYRLQGRSDNYRLGSAENWCRVAGAQATCPPLFGRGDGQLGGRMDFSDLRHFDGGGKGVSWRWQFWGRGRQDWTCRSGWLQRACVCCAGSSKHIVCASLDSGRIVCHARL